jgi:hypothetical protein
VDQRKLMVDFHKQICELTCFRIELKHVKPTTLAGQQSLEVCMALADFAYFAREFLETHAHFQPYMPPMPCYGGQAKRAGKKEANP